MTTIDSEAGKPHPESLRRHEPLINRRFIEIFDHPDNADIARAIPMSLAINDPARPVDAEAPAPASPRNPRRRVTKDAVRYTDSDEDILTITRVDNAEKGWHGFLFNIDGHKVFMADDLDGDAVVEWLNRRFGGKK